MADFTFGSSQ